MKIWKAVEYVGVGCGGKSMGPENVGRVEIEESTRTSKELCMRFIAAHPHRDSLYLLEIDGNGGSTESATPYMLAAVERREENEKRKEEESLADLHPMAREIVRMWWEQDKQAFAKLVEPEKYHLDV